METGNRDDLLTLEDVRCHFPVRQGMLGEVRHLRAVDGVDLVLRPGQSLGLVGESGCGKSTLGRLVCGLQRPTGGRILFRGAPLPPAGAGSMAAGRIQMVFQDPFSSLDPRCTVGTSVEESLLAGERLSRRERRERVRDMFATVGLAGLERRYPHEFSGGQRQRIAVARALMTHPDLIVCDEPVSALDASVQAQILNLLRQVQEDFGPAYLFISHDLAVVGFMCPHILVMYLGRCLPLRICATAKARCARPSRTSGASCRARWIRRRAAASIPAVRRPRNAAARKPRSGKSWSPAGGSAAICMGK